MGAIHSPANLEALLGVIEPADHSKGHFIPKLIGQTPAIEATIAWSQYGGIRLPQSHRGRRLVRLGLSRCQRSGRMLGWIVGISSRTPLVAAWT
jgi:hypothetical protein